jgi:DNA mismatch repair protein MSH5
VEASSGTFQIRPHKDFLPAKGRDRILSLRLLSDLPIDEDTYSPEVGSNPEPRNAYDFMRSRRSAGEDPTMKKWNASIRLANFASADSSPLCVRRFRLLWEKEGNFDRKYSRLGLSVQS